MQRSSFHCVRLREQVAAEHAVTAVNLVSREKISPVVTLLKACLQQHVGAH